MANHKFCFEYHGFKPSLVNIMLVSFNGKVTFYRLRVIAKFARAFMEDHEIMIRVELKVNGIHKGYLDVFNNGTCDYYFNENGQGFEVYR